MIDLGRPAFHAQGVTLFADHAEANTLHYLPDRPRLRMRGDDDNLPELSLLKYQLDERLHHALGAGLLSLTVDLGVDETVLESVGRRAAARFHLTGPVKLVPVTADSGTCELVLIDRASRDDAAAPADGTAPAAPGLVARIVGNTTPSLFGANAATFHVVLEAEGVTLVERALRQSGLPAGVVYNLQTRGLRPALRVRVSARWEDMYTFYENRLHGGKLLVATDIGPTIEELEHRELLKIEVDELVPIEDVPIARQQALDYVQRYVLEQFFKPTLGQAPPAEDGETGALETIGRAIKDIAGFFSLTYSLRELKREELKTFDLQQSVARAERLTLAPQGTFPVLLDGNVDPPRLDLLIKSVEAAASAEMRFDVGLAANAESEGIDRVEAFVTYDGRVHQLELDATTPRDTLRLWYRESAGLAVRYRYDVHFRAGTPGLTSTLSSPERTTEARVLRLDPRELYQRREIRAVASGLPFDRYPTVLVDVAVRDPRRGWEMTDALRLDAAHVEAAFRVRAALDDIVRFRRRLRYIDPNGRETEVPWEDVDPGIFIVGDPLPEIIDVQILASARFGTKVRRLVVELRPRSDPSRVAVRLLTAEQPASSWSWAAGADDDRGYDYRVTVHTALGEVREGRWLAGPPGKLIVGEGIARLRQVELLLLGKRLPELGLLAIKVRFSREDPAGDLPVEEEEILVTDPTQPIGWAYAVASENDVSFTYQLTLIRTDGQRVTEPPVTTSDLMAVRVLT